MNGACPKQNHRVLKHLAVFAGRDPGLALEQPGQVRLVREPAVHGDVGHAVVPGQPRPGALHPGLSQEGVGRDPELPLEHAHQVVRGQSGLAGHLGQGQVLAVAVLDDLPRPVHGPVLAPGPGIAARLVRVPPDPGFQQPEQARLLFHERGLGQLQPPVGAVDLQGQGRVVQHPGPKMGQVRAGHEFAGRGQERIGREVEHAVGPARGFRAVAVVRLARDHQVDLAPRGHHGFAAIPEAHGPVLNAAHGESLVEMAGEPLGHEPRAQQLRPAPERQGRDVRELLLR